MKIYAGSRCDEWGTPLELIALLGLKEDTLDVCASAENHKFAQYWTKEDDCLNRDWPREQWCWMNPPFSQALSFFKKAAHEAAKGSKIVAIYKASNLETEVWQDVIFTNASAVLFLKGRTNYVTGQDNSKGVPFGSAIIYFNMWPLQSRLKGKFFRLKLNREHGDIFQTCRRTKP